LALGGVGVSAADRRRPVAVWVLVGAELLVFVASLAASQQLTPLPDVLAAGWRETMAVDAGQRWRLLSCLLLHANWLHLVLNLTALAYVGLAVERRCGPAVLLTWFVTGGAAGAVAGLRLGYVSVGCSGALVALVAAEIVGGRRLGQTLAIWLVVVLTAGFWLPRIDHAAHLGGLLAGMGFGLVQGWFGRHRLLRRSAAVVSAGLLVGCAIPMAWAMWPLADLETRAPDGMGLGVLVPATWLVLTTGPERTAYTAPGVPLSMVVQRLPEPAPSGNERARWLLQRHAGARLLAAPRRIDERFGGEFWWLRVQSRAIEDEYVWCWPDSTVVLTGLAEGDTIRRYAPVFGHVAANLVVQGGGE